MTGYHGPTKKSRFSKLFDRNKDAAEADAHTVGSNTTIKPNDHGHGTQGALTSNLGEIGTNPDGPGARNVSASTQHGPMTQSSPLQVSEGVAKLALKDHKRRAIYGAQDLGLPVSSAGASTVSHLSWPTGTSQSVNQDHDRSHSHDSISVRRTSTENTRSPHENHISVVRLHPQIGGPCLIGRIGTAERPCLRFDEDRDVEGNLLPAPNQPFITASGSRSLNTRSSSEHPQETTLKRKRMFHDMPPPAFIYVRTNRPNFTVFEGFLLYPELCFLLARELPVRDLISLYAISQDFHIIINSRFTTVCLNQALAKAPESARIFHFRNYKKFCRTDPAARIPHPDKNRAAAGEVRLVPSFRWLQMVIYREKLMHELIAVFAEYGCPLPPRCGLALKRMWYLMDMPTNSLRIGTIHNHELVTNMDLYFAMAFFVKLDMVCNDPVAPEKRDGLRKLMLSMPDGMTTVHRVLTRQRWRHKADMVIAWIRHSLDIPSIVNNPTPEELRVSSVFNIPAPEVGLLKFEHWGRRGRVRGKDINGRELQYHYLLRVDQLVMREAIRRGLRFHKHILRSMLYGYVRPDTLENYAPRKWPRRIPEFNDEEYGINDAVGGIRASNLEEGGDPLLDLGDTSTGSCYTHVPEDPHELAGQMTEREDAFLEMIEWWHGDELPKQTTDDLVRLEELRD